MGLLDRLKNPPPAAAKPSEKVSLAQLAAASRNVEERFDRLAEITAWGKVPVRDSEDLQRILALPRREPPEEGTPEGAALIRRMTARLRNDVAAGAGCLCHKLNPQWRSTEDCIVELRFIQAWYLAEAEAVGGALGPIAVGAGKTGIDILTAMVVPGCKEAALLLPPTLKPQFIADFQLWAQHFRVPNIAGGRDAAIGAGPRGEFITDGRPTLHVLKYSELSSKNFSTWFLARPDISVVVADEAQALKDHSATRVKRFLAHFVDHDATRFCCHTGSLSSKGIEDFAHLSTLALRRGSPVPNLPSTVTEWGTALNPPKNGLRAPPGALMKLCREGETVEQGFARRFIDTAGVVATSEGSLTGVELFVSERKPPKMPIEVREAMAKVRREKKRPDGEELKDSLEIAAVIRQLAMGFYLYWHYPDATPADFDEGGRVDDWFKKRQAWNREVRYRLEEYTPQLDSPGLLKEAAKRACAGYRGEKPTWHSHAWPAWAAVEYTLPHETRVEWVSDWLAHDAAEWMLKQEAEGRPGICWTVNPDLGHLIAKLAGRPYYGAGDEAAIGIRAELGNRSVVASIPAHHRGRNLQAFSANLVTQPPSGADVWEQLIGRTHRSKQLAKYVTVEVYRHVTELSDAFDVAMGRAFYVKNALTSDQKLLAAREVLNPH